MRNVPRKSRSFVPSRLGSCGAVVLAFALSGCVAASSEDESTNDADDKALGMVDDGQGSSSGESCFASNEDMFGPIEPSPLGFIPEIGWFFDLTSSSNGAMVPSGVCIYPHEHDSRACLNGKWVDDYPACPPGKPGDFHACPTIPSPFGNPDVPKTTYTYWAQGERAFHLTGHPDVGDWAATVGVDMPGRHMLYGPYARDWGGWAARAVFYVMVDDTTHGPDDIVATLDIYDGFIGGDPLVRRDLRRKEFGAPFVEQTFTLETDLYHSLGDPMEARVFWQGSSWVRVSRVEVTVPQSL